MRFCAAWGAEAGSIAANARALAESSMRFDARMAQTLAAYDKARANARKRGAPV